MDPDPGLHLVFRLDLDPHKTDADPKHWPKGYWPASEKFLKGKGKPLGNAQIPATSQEERRHNFLAAIG
jgi:hypothetical protein